MTAPPPRIRVLIVDDSALVRRIVTGNLAKCPDIEVVGTACDPYIAKDKIQKLKPDVLTLDIEMPKMDGITFLRLLMRAHPMPVIVMSSLANDGSRAAIAALEAGAVDVLGKPDGPWSAFDDNQLAAKIRAAASARTRPRLEAEPAPVTLPGIPPALRPPPPAIVRPRIGETILAGRRHLPERPPAAKSPSVYGFTERKPLSRSPNIRLFDARSLILMGASTGGTEALKAVLTQLPPGLPGICVVQHIPARFSTAFANRLNELCAFPVREAENGDVVKPGHALVAPGGWHMVLRWRGDHYIVELSDAPQVHHQRPAVDILFDSAMKGNVSKDSVGVLLTGMGSDGARGLLHLRQHGLETIAQNEETSVVYGMPRAAVELGAAQHILPLPAISGAIIDHYASAAVASLA